MDDEDDEAGFDAENHVFVQPLISDRRQRQLQGENLHPVMEQNIGLAVLKVSTYTVTPRYTNVVSLGRGKNSL